MSRCHGDASLGNAAVKRDLVMRVPQHSSDSVHLASVSNETARFNGEEQQQVLIHEAALPRLSVLVPLL